MGFMDKFKQAGDMMKAGTSPAMAEYAQMVNKIGSSGVPCTAVINAVGESGATDGFNKEFTFEVTVEGIGEPYNAIVVQYLSDDMAGEYREGVAFNAKADPDDKTNVILYGKL